MKLGLHCPKLSLERGTRRKKGGVWVDSGPIGGKKFAGYHKDKVCPFFVFDNIHLRYLATHVIKGPSNARLPNHWKKVVSCNSNFET